VQKKKSVAPKPISEKQRESDNALTRELEHADPEKFKRLIKPLFRSSDIETEQNERGRKTPTLVGDKSRST
jgi:hypothetical protein